MTRPCGCTPDDRLCPAALDLWRRYWAEQDARPGGEGARELAREYAAHRRPIVARGYPNVGTIRPARRGPGPLFDDA